MQRPWGREGCGVWEERTSCRWSLMVEKRDRGPEEVINTASLRGRGPSRCVNVRGVLFPGAEDAPHVFLFGRL